MSVTVVRARNAAKYGAVSAALVLQACALALPVQPQREQTSVPPAPSPVPSAIAAAEAAVIAEVNAIRRGEGLRALQRMSALDRAARSHAQEMAERGVVDHQSSNPERRTPGARVTAEGVDWLGVAENLAAMTDSGAGVGRRSATLWIGSDGHRVNMLNPTYTHTGVGVAVDRRGVWYVTQLYVLPRAR